MSSAVISRTYCDDAIISSCGEYRYRLTRVLDSGGYFWSEKDHLICWIMLNPSVADATHDDPTIRKVMGFSKRWGYRVVDVYNLFAFRETDPKKLMDRIGQSDYDPVGPDNDIFLKQIPYNVKVVAAWGETGWSAARSLRAGELLTQRIFEVKKILKARHAKCLGKTVNGSPRHPVRLSYATPLVEYA